MIRFFRVLARAMGWALRARALRPVLWFAIFVWMFSGAIKMATDAAWFASVGLSSLWREQMAWMLGVGGAFIIVCVALGVPLMRAIARPVTATMDEPALPRALERWQPLRARAPRLGWLLIGVVALLLGRDLSAHWSEFALALGASGDTANKATDFWMTRAPALERLLAATWTYSLTLGIVALAAGSLRALPFLAARPNIRPTRWLRALWLVGAAICALRALGFIFEATRHAQTANDASAIRVGFILLNVAGALGCLLLALLLRRPRAKLALGVAAILILPGLGGDLLAPFAEQSTVPLPTPSPLTATNGPVPVDWPQWDETTLLHAARLHIARDKNGRLVEWQSAGIATSRDGRRMRADLVGAPVISDAWAGHGLADRDSALAWKSIDLPTEEASRDGQPVGPLFYGLNARPLLSEDPRDAGAPFQGWMWKLAWAWQLRDPLMVFEGAKAKRLLVVRGAREIGQKIAPFWTWDEAVPRRDAKGGVYFECIAYSSSARGSSRPFDSGIFAGQNTATPVAVLRLDARSGAVQLAPFSPSNGSSTRWKAILPALFGSNAPQNAPLNALQTALADGTPMVWTRTPAGWQKQAIPLELRTQVTEKLNEFAGIARTHSSSRLEGATSVIWRERGELYLAQAFFDLATTSSEPVVAEGGVLPPVSGIAVGPIGTLVTRWSSSFSGARAALWAPTQSPNPKATPSSKTTRSSRPDDELAQEALEALHGANKALQAGKYVEQQKQSQHAEALLQQLARPKH